MRVPRLKWIDRGDRIFVRKVEVLSKESRPVRFTSLIAKNLFRRPFRSLLTLAALTTAIASVVALLGIASGFKESFAGVYRSHSVDIVVSRQGAADRLSSSLDASIADRIGNVPGVQKSAVVLLETLSLEQQGVYGIPAMGLRPDSWMMENFQFQSSGNDQSEDRRVWLGKNLADRLETQPGDTVLLFDDPYRVADVFTSRSTWENGSMVLPLNQLQALTGREDQVTYVNVVIDPASTQQQAGQVVRRIESLDAKLLPLLTEDFVSTDTRMQIASAMAWMTSVIAILIGAVGTLNTMMTSVVERTGEIGILRAIGWSRRRVVAMILGESCLLAVASTLSGIACAVVLTWLMSRSPAVAGVLNPSIRPVVMLQGSVIGVGIGVIGAFLPAVRAARLMPTDAFRDLA